jgi:hypothetical protein
VKKIQSLITIIIIIAMTLLTLPAVSATPKIVSPFEQHLLFSATGGSPGTQVTLGNRIYVTNAVSTGNEVATSAPILSGTYSIKLSGFFDTTSGTGRFFGKWLITAHGDGFSGTIMGTSKSTSNPAVFEIKGTFIGFGEGIYSADKIKGSFSGTVNYGTLTVDMIMTGTFYDKTLNH